MDGQHPTSFERWQGQVPDVLRNDLLWNYVAYPKALFLFELAWFDCEHLLKDVRGRVLAGQLTRAASSVSANIEEGYSKGFGADYARYLQIALGSARETRGWYWRAHMQLPCEVVEHRMQLATEIIQLLMTTIVQQRSIGRRKST